MSARAGIVSAIVDKLKQDVNGTGDYVLDLQGNVSNETKHFEKINDFPHVSVTPGPEYRDYLPSRQTFAELTVYFRIYVKQEEEAQLMLEQIISDLETFIDINQKISYNVVRPTGTEQHRTVDSGITTIRTDEGVLSPFGIGEIAVTIKYERTRLM